MSEQPEAKPGDEVPPGRAESTGQDVCWRCGGSGEVDGRECETCGGTGTVEEAVGGG
jgi:DnaJ-class molecular chaperone